jgi:hypothetical protein
MSTPAPKYSRISIYNTKDTKKLYSLLKTYVQDPSRAEIISEVAIDSQSWYPMFDLFSLCKNITTLHLAEELHPSVDEYMIKLNYGDIKNPGLQNLKHVHFTPGSDRYDSRYYATVEILRYMQLIHRLPALESVTMDALQEYQPTYVYFVPRSGNMKKLEITHCHIGSDYLARMISIPKALEEFRLSIGGMWSIDGGSPIYSPSQIGKALAAHKDTLRVLDIDANISIRADKYPGVKHKDDEADLEERACRHVRGRPGDPYGRDRIAADKAISIKPKITEEDAKEQGQTVVSFHDYPRLTHLSIGTVALLGDCDDDSGEPPFKLAKPAPFRLVEYLPPSLEYLCIYGYVRGVNPDVDEHVDEFLDKKSEKLPKLKVVKGVEELVPGLMDVFGHTDLSDEKDLYVREEMDREWKEVEV